MTRLPQFQCLIPHRWFGKRHTFIGMLDADEFVVIKDVAPGHAPDLRAFLKPYEAHGGLVVSQKLQGINRVRSYRGSTESWIQ